MIIENSELEGKYFNWVFKYGNILKWNKIQSSIGLLGFSCITIRSILYILYVCYTLCHAILDLCSILVFFAFLFVMNNCFIFRHAAQPTL